MPRLNLTLRRWLAGAATLIAASVMMAGPGATPAQADVSGKTRTYTWASWTVSIKSLPSSNEVVIWGKITDRKCDDKGPALRFEFDSTRNFWERNSDGCNTTHSFRRTVSAAVTGFIKVYVGRCSPGCSATNHWFTTSYSV